MAKVNEKKRKLILVSVTFVLCITIMLTGTFAWSSISQTVINETMGDMLNPGGRLHDDFNGSNKDIYVENFNEGVDSMDIIVRIRLSEYMEIGPDAGINRDSKSRNVNILTMHDTDDDGTDDVPADIKTTSTWDIVTPTNDNHYGYWSWSLGGQTAYLPTLDTDTGSKSVDRNGTYEGNDGDLTQGTPFDDYHTYVEGNVYDGRTAKNTIDGTVMNMDYWLTHGEMKLGNYWVYDADGWAYWANPLSAQEATGLLLDKISHSRTIEDKWYYAINVECQMVTVDEIGNADNEKGFYSEDALTPPSDSARWLLDALIKEIGYVEVEAGTYGMYTADISEEELQSLLNQAEDSEEKPDTDTKETDLEDLTEPNETEDKEETVEEDKEPEDGTKTDTSDKDTPTDTETEESKPSTDETGNEDTAGDATGGTSDNTVGNPTTGTEGAATDDSNTGDTATGNELNGENATVGDENDETNTTEATETGENIEQTSTNPQTAI